MPRQLDYHASEHIDASKHKNAYTRPNFPVANRVRRLAWNIFWLLFFRFSPRPFHAWRSFLLRLWGAAIGPNCHFYPGAKVWAPWNLICADHVTAGDGVEIYNPSPMHFHSHVILSQDSYLCGATHDCDDPAFPLLSYTMTFEQYSWICARACVGPGVNVGEGAVLGLGAVAMRDLTPWTIYTGNPAIALRERKRHPDASPVSGGTAA